MPAERFYRNAKLIQRSFEQVTKQPGIYYYGRDFSRAIYEQNQNRANEGEKTTPSEKKDQILPIYKRETFRTHAWQCGREDHPDASLNPREIIASYNIYQKAVVGTNLPFIVAGRLPLIGRDGQYIPSDERFPSIDLAMESNLGVVNDDVMAKTGSIIERPNWSLLRNDSWFLGAFHAGGTEIHFASPLRKENFWDPRNYRMTLMAREIIGMMLAGYKIWKPHLKLEPVAFVDEKNKEKAMNTGLVNAGRREKSERRAGEREDQKCQRKREEESGVTKKAQRQASSQDRDSRDP